MINITNKQREIIERLDWHIYECNFSKDCVGFELEKYSPSGEDFTFAVEAKSPCDLVNEIKKYSACFDIDEHIEMWIEARNNGVTGVPSVRELVQDACEIDKMLQELAYALSESCSSCIADEHNKILGVTKAQAEAMLCGSMFGWHVPGADPNNYDADGRMI